MYRSAGLVPLALCACFALAACGDNNGAAQDSAAQDVRHQLDGAVQDDASPQDDGGVQDDGPPQNDSGGSASEVVCQTLSPLAGSTCSVTAGDSGRVITGTILTPTTIYRGGQVVVDATGQIVQVGCAADCTGACQTTAASATQILCPSGVVSPGLINPHDHITYTNDPPYTDTGERYEHRHEWRKALNGHTKIPAPGGATANQISWGELRFLFGGATSTIGSGGRTGLLRNLDKATM
jgi:large repetitive protein